MPRYFVIFFFLILLSSCSQEENIPVELEVDPIVPVVSDRYDPCEFDLAYSEGDFDLLRTWEFVGFQTILTQKFDNYRHQTTCMARFSSVYRFDSTKDDPFQFLLALSEGGDETDCDQKFELNGCLISIKQCFVWENTTGKIQFLFSEETDVEYLFPSGTLPEFAFDELYLKAIQGTLRYQIESNKLYLYPTEWKERMVYLALDL